MDDLLAQTGRAHATHFWFHGFRAFVAPVLREIAGGRTDLTLVDCGCGTGDNLALLQPYGHAVGFDFSPLGVAEARRSGHPVLRADIVHIPLATASVDLASSFDVFPCVDDDAAGVREMARIVKPGGTVLLTLAALEMLRGDHAELWQEARRYTPSSARRLVEQAGLRVDRVSFMFASVFPLMLSVRLAQRLVRPLRRTPGSADMEVPPAPINAALTGLLRLEALAARRVRMPIGSSLLVVARR
jgi:SAM-dependent methyltransferase